MYNVQCTNKGVRIKFFVSIDKIWQNDISRKQRNTRVNKNRYIKTTKIILPMSFLIDANRVLYSTVYNVRADSCDKAEVQSVLRRP
jgi:hypothetical protein